MFSVPSKTMNRRASAPVDGWPHVMDSTGGMEFSMPRLVWPTTYMGTQTRFFQSSPTTGSRSPGNEEKGSAVKRLRRMQTAVEFDAAGTRVLRRLNYPKNFFTEKLLRRQNAQEFTGKVLRRQNCRHFSELEVPQGLALPTNLRSYRPFSDPAQRDFLASSNTLPSSISLRIPVDKDCGCPKGCQCSTCPGCNEEKKECGCPTGCQCSTCPGCKEEKKECGCPTGCQCSTCPGCKEEKDCGCPTGCQCSTCPGCEDGVLFPHLPRGLGRSCSGPEQLFLPQVQAVTTTPLAAADKEGRATSVYGSWLRQHADFWARSNRAVLGLRSHVFNADGTLMGQREVLTLQRDIETLVAENERKAWLDRVM